MGANPVKGWGVMPKEMIADQAAMYDVHIGWTVAGEYVQIGIETADGIPVVDKLGAGGANPAEFRGLWGTLDRAGCNRAIRAIRQARDAAFGRDE